MNDDVLISRILQAIGYQVPPSVDTGWSPYSLTMFDRKRSATNMFLSLDMDSARICLFSGSIATQSHTYSEPTLICVSSTMNSDNLFFLMIFSLDGVFESSSRWKHGFSLQSRLIFLRLALMTILKNTNTNRSRQTLRVFCFYYSN